MPTYMLTSFLLTRPQRRWVNKAGVTLLTAINNHAVKHTGPAFHSSLRKIMHVTACYMPCMHYVSTPRPPPATQGSKVCEMLDMDFREFVFPDVP